MNSEKTPLTIRDLVMLERVSDPQLSPGGKYLAYVLRSTDLDGNKGICDIGLLNLDAPGQAPRPFTRNGGNNDTPRWSPDGKTLYFLSTRSGSPQVWSQAVDDEIARQVTALPLDVNTYAVAPDARTLALSMDVFAVCQNLAGTRKRLDEMAARKATGQSYHQLFVRHWDT
ncbi:MAG: S9 family peptidase, partial [Stenotrophobium sp.]